MKNILNVIPWDDSSHEARLTTHQKYKQDVSNDICLLQNKLISPQFHHLHKPLVSWAHDLRIALQEIQCERQQHTCDVRIANVFNQSAIVFMELEHFKSAREICYSQIHYFIRWSMKFNAPRLLKYVFQPWIHLIKINRLEGNKYDAFNQLNTLDLTYPGQFVFTENKLLREKIYESLSEDNLLHNAIITQSLLERIKLCFESHQYNELIAFIENKENRFTVRHESLIQEALAIAYANGGKTQKALMILSQGHSQRGQIEDAILKLRELELVLALGVNQPVAAKLILLYESSLSFMNTHTLSHIKYMLHVAVVMQMVGLTRQSVELVYYCFDAAIKTGDEVLKAESLMMLYDWVIDVKIRKKIENLMIAHYHHSQYAVIRRKISHCFNDLKYTETRHLGEIMSLFEDLLAFDVICW